MATEVTFIRSGGLSLREQLATGGSVWGVGGCVGCRGVVEVNHTEFPYAPPLPPSILPWAPPSLCPLCLARSQGLCGQALPSQGRSRASFMLSSQKGGRKIHKRGWAGAHSCRCKECFPRQPVKSCSAGLVTRKCWVVWRLVPYVWLWHLLVLVPGGIHLIPGPASSLQNRAYFTLFMGQDSCWDQIDHAHECALKIVKRKKKHQFMK